MESVSPTRHSPARKCAEILHQMDPESQGFKLLAEVKKIRTIFTGEKKGKISYYTHMENTKRKGNQY